MICINDVYYLKIGKIGKTHGLNGGLHFLPNVLDFDSLILNNIKDFYFKIDESFIHKTLLYYKGSNENFILYFREIESIINAKDYINTNVYIKRSDLKIDIIPEDLLQFQVFKDNFYYGVVSGYGNYGITMLEILNNNNEIELFEFADSVFFFEKNDKKLIIK